MKILLYIPLLEHIFSSFVNWKIFPLWNIQIFKYLMIMRFICISKIIHKLTVHFWMSKSLPIKPRKILKNRLVHETFHGAAEGLNRSHRAAWRGGWFEQTSRASLRTTVQRICLARAANFNLSVFLKRHQKLQGADSSNSEPMSQSQVNGIL